MATNTNAVSSYSQVGVREDLSNTIYRIDPTETPFTSNIGRSKATAAYHEWQIQTLNAAVDTNAAIDGDNATNTSRPATTRVGNRTQIATKVAEVTGRARAVNTAGRDDEMDYQVLLSGLELKRDVEKQMLSNKPSVTGSTSTASQSAGMESWLTTNSQRGAPGANGGFSAGTVSAPTDGTQRAFTEALVQAAQQSCFTNGGKPTMLFLGPAAKAKFSAFTGIAVNRIDNKPGAGQVTIVGGADVYVGDFGELTAVPSRLIRSRTALMVDPKMVKMATLRPMSSWALAKTGDADRKQLLIEYTIEVSNEAAHAAIADLTP
jgi:hypothetical protein